MISGLRGSVERTDFLRRLQYFHKCGREHCGNGSYTHKKKKSAFFLSYWFLLAGFETLARFCFSADSHPTISSSAGVTCMDSS